MDHLQKQLQLKDFYYEISSERIAQNPSTDRDGSKLLHYKPSARGAQIRDLSFRDLSKVLPNGSLLVFNNTRVIPSRLIGSLSTGGRIEIFLLSRNSIDNMAESWNCLAKPARKIRPGVEVFFANNLVAKVKRRRDVVTPEVPHFEIEFSMLGVGFRDWLEHNGLTPLPPYIQRKHSSLEQQVCDRERYQTVYASVPGSVAAPTAGLHFTQEIFEDLRKCGHERCEITLDVGAGTFMPVKSSEIAHHKMHIERYKVPRRSWEMIVHAQKDRRPIIAVGTTTLRCLESFIALARDSNPIEEILDQYLETCLFIYPKTRSDRYRSIIFKGIITNFHQPESTLFMLICSLIGYEEAMLVYKHALSKDYRFFSYGDSSLLELE